MRTWSSAELPQGGILLTLAKLPSQILRSPGQGVSRLKHGFESRWATRIQASLERLATEGVPTIFSAAVNIGLDT